MSELTPIAQFVQLSAILTGVSAKLLAPEVDPINIKQTYFDWLQTHAGSTFDALLQQYMALAAEDQSAEQIGQTILAKDYGNLARSIMLLWYLGSWYHPPSTGTPQVVSANAYTTGWSWKIAQAHPMGFSQLRFGYWSEVPPPLQAFVSSEG
jgi:hypothetical protein